MTYKSSQVPVESIGYFTKFIIFLLTVGFMSVGVYFSSKLLSWSMDTRLSSIVPKEQNQITAELRERQLICLARNIYYEAGSEPFEGKVAVAQVTINRTQSGQFPSDICQTVYQKNIIYAKTVCQFSWYCDRATQVRPVNKAVYDECMVVAKKVLLEGYRLPSLTQALYYHADYINPGWKRQRVAKIGKHIFYR